MEADAHITDRVADLEASLDELTEANEKLSAEREQYRELYLQMLELNKKLERGILGQKAEKLPADESQLTLQLLASLLKRDGLEKIEDEAPRQEVGSHRRRKPTGRKPLPAELPHVDIEILPEEVQRQGLDAFDRIGEEVRETVERRPSSMVRGAGYDQARRRRMLGEPTSRT